MRTDAFTLTEFLLEAMKLKDIPRTGWRRIGIQTGESVADHIFGVILLAYLLGDSRGLNQERLIKMALIHDLPEAHTGDIPRSSESVQREKLITESRILHEIVESMPRRLREEISDLWREYARGETREATFLRELDKLEMAFQALRYERSYPNLKQKLEQFWASAKAVVRDDDLLETLSRLSQLST
ncbi:MAG: HD domain-containing protein [Candidatus Geothermarchaeales archaeon]